MPQWVRDKISATMKGRHPVNEYKKGHAAYMPHHTEQSRKAISETSKARWANPEYREMAIGNMQGKKQSVETIAKRMQTWEKEGHPSLGKYHTEEWKQQQSERNSGEGNPFYGKHHTAEAIEKNRIARSK